MIMTFPSFAVDNQSDKYKDHLYSAWTDFRDHKYRVWFSSSTDRGNSWSQPNKLTRMCRIGVGNINPWLP